MVKQNIILVGKISVLENTYVYLYLFMYVMMQPKMLM